MTRAGRKPDGPALVRHLEGSEQAKERLEVILETIVGRLTIGQACQRLGISPAMLFRLRTEVLEAGLSRLEPRPLGRPPHVRTPEEQRSVELARRVEELESDLKIAAVREEIAQVLMRGETAESPAKKTTGGKSRRNRRRGKIPRSRGSRRR
jgi:hypothetical protein